ncbi:MAG TPA: DUF4392 domain-containing protein [Synergistales bacterium]|nr:DUF4392 domain-containing protein [Synergistales bacterium]
MKPFSQLSDHLLHLVASDRCGRSLSMLCSPRIFEEALVLLETSSRPVIVTGFFVPSSGAPETDGPPGAAVLARALRRMKRDPAVVTDRWNEKAVDVSCRMVGLQPPMVARRPGEVLALEPDLVVFIERLGKNGDGRYYNMKGEDISRCTDPLDDMAGLAMEGGIPVLAIGDGGNEAGMANLMPGLCEVLPGFNRCLSTVPSTVALPVDVSNWGAYALTCLLSCRRGQWLGHGPEEERKMIEAMVSVGAVDGVTGRRELSVDGLGIAEHMKVVARLKEIYKEFSIGKGRD